MRVIKRLSAFWFFHFLVFSIVWPYAAEGRRSASGFHLSPGGDGRKIFIPLEANSVLFETAVDLKRVLSEITGADYSLHLMTPLNHTRNGIFLYEHPALSRFWHFNPPSSLFPNDDLAIVVQDGQILLGGRNQHGAAMAVYAFLEQKLGMRWFWPDDLGEVFPDDPPKRLSNSQQILIPDYGSRHLIMDAGDAARRLWLLRNRLLTHGHIDHRHHLHYWVPPELFDQKPDFFPMKNGQRFRPPPGRVASRFYQPELGNPVIAEFIAQHIHSYWDQHPEKRTVSIAINDNQEFGNSPETMRWVDPELFFREYPVRTDLIMQFSNRVAEILYTKGWNDRLLGAYAYHTAEAPPSFPIHPMVFPMLTADRSQWVHDEFRIEDRNNIKDWGRMVQGQFGIYEYAYGHPFPFPRLFPQHLAESIKLAHLNGATAYTAESFPLWPFDGDKFWLIAQLLWDSQQCPKTLRNEFYDLFFGPASVPMKEFYGEAEAAWKNQKGPARWLKHYLDEDAIGLFGQDKLSFMRDLLKKALDISDRGSPYHRRINQVACAFRLPETLHLLYEVRRTMSMPKEDFAGTTQWTEAIQSLREFEKLTATVVDIVQDRIEDPEDASVWHRAVTRPINYSDPRSFYIYRMIEAGIPAEKLPLLSEIGQDNGGIRRLVGLAINNNLPDWTGLPNLLANDQLAGKNKEGSFWRDPEPLPLTTGWDLAGRGSEFLKASVKLPDQEDEPGIVRVSGAHHLAFRSLVSVEGFGTYRIQIELRGRISPDNRSSLRLQWRDIHGNILPVSLTYRLPAGDHPSFSPITLLWQAPPSARELYVRIITQHQAEGDFLEIGRCSVQRF